MYFDAFYPRFSEFPVLSFGYEQLLSLVVVQSVIILVTIGRLDQTFSDAFARDYQLIEADPKHSL